MTLRRCRPGGKAPAKSHSKATLESRISATHGQEESRHTWIHIHLDSGDSGRRPGATCQ